MCRIYVYIILNEKSPIIYRCCAALAEEGWWKGMTIQHSNEFVQSHFSDGFLMKYLNMII